MSSELPTPQKTWTIATIAHALTGTEKGNQIAQKILVKNWRKSMGHVVVGSGNGVTGAHDGVDRWNSAGDFPNFSLGVWFLFRNPVTGAEDIVRYANFGENDWLFAHSPDGGFTGGTSIAKPTAPHETELYNNSWFGRGDGGANPQYVTHLWSSTDLACFRQSYWFNNFTFGDIFYDAVESPSPGWGAPNYAMLDKHGVAISSDQSVGQINNYVITPFTGVGIFKGWGPHGAMNLLGTSEASGYSALVPMSTECLQQKNKISGTYRNVPRCGLYTVISEADGGWHGRVFDMWWVGRNLFAHGDTTPLDGSKQFVIIGDRLLPWNGTTFRTA